jgi:hypothetical protein
MLPIFSTHINNDRLILFILLVLSLLILSFSLVLYYIYKKRLVSVKWIPKMIYRITIPWLTNEYLRTWHCIVAGDNWGKIFLQTYSTNNTNNKRKKKAVRLICKIVSTGQNST